MAVSQMLNDFMNLVLQNTIEEKWNFLMQLKCIFVYFKRMPRFLQKYTSQNQRAVAVRCQLATWTWKTFSDIWKTVFHMLNLLFSIHNLKIYVDEHQPG